MPLLKIKLIANFMKRKKTNDFKRSKSILLLRIVLLIATFNLGSAQVFGNIPVVDDEKVVTGKVMAPDGSPVFEATVTVKETAFVTETDENGLFSVTALAVNPTLVISKDEFETKEIAVGGKNELVVTLVPIKYIDLLWARQKKDYVSCAVSYVSGEELNDLPGVNRLNVLGGRLAGLTVQQSNGEPGIENSSIYMRGLRTMGSANNSPYILVDGYLRMGAEYLNSNDIESITLLKDAAATAIYGLKGSNGLLSITTKRGKAEPMKVSFDAKYGLQTPTRLPQYLGSYDHAVLYNEASRNDGGADIYDAAALEAYRTGSEPYRYPNVDWANEFLKDYSTQQNYNLSVRGGSKKLRYFASAGYIDNTGLYQVDKDANPYNTNQDFQMFMLRSNIDIQVTEKMLVSMDMGGRQQKWNYPGNLDGSVNRIFSVLYQLPPNVFPVKNEDGSVSGNAQYLNNPYGLLNLSGYSTNTMRATDASFKVTQDLDMILKGLSFRGVVSFDSYFNQAVRRHKGFVVYEGSLENERGVKSPVKQQNSNEILDNQRVFDMQFGVDYIRQAGKHQMDGRIFWNQNNFSGDGSIMPHTYQGVMGRMNYIFDERYIADLSFAYQGSEQISDKQRYVLFPALSLGWIIKKSTPEKNLVSFLKVRGSHGLTGNDSGISYFQKLSFFTKVGSTYLFGDNLAALPGYREGVLGDENITAEKTRKTDIGIDSRFFNDKLSLTADLFYEKTTDIIIALNSGVPGLLGAPEVPRSNAGIIENKGFEVQLSYGGQLKDFSYLIAANLSSAKSKVLDMQEQEYAFAHNYRTGYPVDAKFGLKQDGFFYDENDITSSPLQTYGPVKPGDLKYKDITKNGTVDIDDISYIGKSWMPEMVYGAIFNLSFKGIDLSVLVEGISIAEKYLSNYAYWEFYPNGTGKVMDHHQGRWAYYPDLSIDTRTTATYPRLSLTGNNTNNKAPNSNFWLKDASYTRLKSVELGYTLPGNAVKFLKLSKLRFFATGYNLLTFDKINVIDPEAPGSGNSYPIQRIINFGINAQF